jgi:hypothetical protein
MCSTTGATVPRIQLCFRVDREALVDVTRALPGIKRRRQDELAATPERQAASITLIQVVGVRYRSAQTYWSTTEYKHCGVSGT